MPGIPTGNPYVIPGQTQIYPQGPPPTYDQALTHPAAIVGQHVRSKQLKQHDTILLFFVFSDVSTRYYVYNWISDLFGISNLYSDAVLSIFRCLFVCNATNTIETCYYDPGKFNNRL